MVKTSDNSQLFTFFANNTDLAMPGTVRFDRELGLYAKIIGGNHMLNFLNRKNNTFVKFFVSHLFANNKHEGDYLTIFQHSS